MAEYVIDKIYSNGYERICILNDKNNKTLTAGFLELDEYLENDEASQKRTIGEVIEGNLSIVYVCDKINSDNKLHHNQTIPNSPYIEATIIVAKSIDEYSFYAISSVADYEILVKFEQPIAYAIGEKLFIEGELSINV